MHKSRTLIVCGLACSLACTGGEDTDTGRAIERSRVGDTTVVSVPGLPEPGEWVKVAEVGVLDGPPEEVFGRIASTAIGGDGELFVVDQQAGAIRVFDGDGTYRGTWGRSGQGPGELSNPDAGAAVLPDGRLVVRDPGNARMQLFAGGGEADGTWPVLTGQFINRRPLGVRGDTVLNPDVVNPTAPLGEWRLGLVRILDDGRILDTLPVPSYGRSAHRFIARDEGNAAEIDLPFDPTEHWAYSRRGYLVHGVGDAYDVLLDDPESPLRLKVAVDRYPVEPALREQERERVLNAMRWLDPSWSWDGPGIPREKPAFAGIFAGEDGRIWVMRETRAYETEDPDFDPDEPYHTEIRWRVDRVLDGFDPDGSPVGSGRLPREVDLRVPPVLRGDTLWAVTADELGVQRVGKFVLGG